MKAPFLILFFGTFLFTTVSSAQCKYESQEKDIITNETNFVTKRFQLSKSISKGKEYSLKNLSAKFEKKGKTVSLIINYSLMNSFGKLVIYSTKDDSLIVKFGNGQVYASR
jgi:hypothetical protein